MHDDPAGRDFLGPILRALAESLDVRDIFARISEEARRVIPHDFLMLGELNDDKTRVHVVALSGELPGGDDDVAIPESLRSPSEGEIFILEDVTVDATGSAADGWLRPGGTGPRKPISSPLHPFFRQLHVERGIRSSLRVGVHLRGGLVGGLIFCSTGPRAFSSAHVHVAQTIADCVALAVAHQRLAEEEQRSAQARRRAAELEHRVHRLTEELNERGAHRVLGHSRSWRHVLEQATKVAATDATVLLTGESGTGKEVIARFIHRASPRAQGPFVALNCAALPEQLLESELFGHEKGAFTGALAAHAGRIDQASGGVLFLDEVAEMSPAVQAKFLRVLQEREFQRLGGSRTLKADIRVLAATNRELGAATAAGRFREDLYYRLAVFDIALPPLRQRRDDIAMLVDAFVAEIGRTIGRPAAGVTSEARDVLVAHAWPGNVRELRNVVERAVILCEGGLIRSEHLPSSIVDSSRHLTDEAVQARATAPASSANRGTTLDAAEREMIVQALARTGNNKSKAARLLGLTRAQLRSRIEKHGIAAES